MTNDPRYKTFLLLQQRRRRLAQRLEKALVAARAELRRAQDELCQRQAARIEHERKVDAHDRRLVETLDAPGGFSPTELMSLRDFRNVLMTQAQALEVDVSAAERAVGEREQALAESQRNIARNNAQLDALDTSLKDLATAHELAVEDQQDEEAEEAHGARLRGR
ncbi:hypothetical protein [Paraburkholderia sp. CI3]|uniref:hypothetical protein n=1 Tax=Paraburkholderia sp. CI3 TaxID=2991060 RepID=UPI003D20C47D